ncbi:MAG: transposase [Planctomycetota bacterium]|nr:transposase [Planctomycetota bacterium]
MTGVAPSLPECKRYFVTGPKDHVHLLVSTPLNVAPSDLVWVVKGESA